MDEALGVFAVEEVTARHLHDLVRRAVEATGSLVVRPPQQRVVGAEECDAGDGGRAAQERRRAQPDGAIITKRSAEAAWLAKALLDRRSHVEAVKLLLAQKPTEEELRAAIREASHKSDQRAVKLVEAMVMQGRRSWPPRSIGRRKTTTST